MRSQLKIAIAAVAVVCAVALLVATASGSPGTGLTISEGWPAGVSLGLLFWVVVTFIAAALPVRFANGASVDLSLGPLMVVMTLGGPVAVGWVSLVGATSIRELRRELPWYGVLANHSTISLSAISGAAVFATFPGRENDIVNFVATLTAGLTMFTINIAIVSVFIALRTGQQWQHNVRSNAGAFLSLLALAPLAWLMAKIYVTAGWWAILLFAVPLYTTRVAYQRFVAIREMFTQTVSSLAEAVDKRDEFTSGHSRRVQQIAVDIGRVMKLSDDELEALEWGGLLHDIGKIGVRDNVLLKEQRLTREERREMNRHPILGAEIIAPVQMLAPELPIIRHHHEWFNGSGYPDRLAGDAIPRLARVLHVADAFEAMTAIRPYRPTPLTHEQAIAELRKFGGIQFDPDVVDAFTQTRWARGAVDPGRVSTSEVPLLGQQVEALATMSTEVGRSSSLPLSSSAPP